MTEPYERLQQSRARAGWANATDAARAFGWNENTYRSHENGERGLKAGVAERYGKAFKVSAAWLLTGEGAELVKTVPLVGFVSAGSIIGFLGDGQGPFDEVPAPPNATATTVAVGIKGDCMGPFLNGWYAFYEGERNPPSDRFMGKLCIVWLEDDQVMMKKISPGTMPGLYKLESQFEPPIYDALVDWVCLVTALMPNGSA